MTKYFCPKCNQLKKGREPYCEKCAREIYKKLIPKKSEKTSDAPKAKPRQRSVNINSKSKKTMVEETKSQTGEETPEEEKTEGEEKEEEKEEGEEKEEEEEEKPSEE